MTFNSVNYNFRPQTPIKSSQNIGSNNNKSGEKVKPTLQNMNELYEIYCSAQIVYFPVAAATASAQKRTQALETYIKNNNLNIEDVQNLEHFFAKVKEETSGGKLGMMGTLQVQSMMFNEYLENGYDPNEGEGKLASERENARDARLNLERPRPNLNLNWQVPPLPEGTVDNNIGKSETLFSDIDTILNDNINGSSGIFK